MSIVVLLLVIYGVSGTSIDWNVVIDGTGRQEATAMFIDDHGVYLSVNSVDSPLFGQPKGHMNVKLHASSGSLDWANTIATSYTSFGTLSGDETFVYSGGEGSKCFVAKYAANSGSLIWKQTSSVDLLYTKGVAAVNSYVYVAGTARGSVNGQTHFGGYDIFVSKFAPNGTHVWTRQFGSSGDESEGGAGGDDVNIAVDNNMVFVCGYASGAMLSLSYHGGFRDVVCVAYSFDGALQWARLLGGSGEDVYRTMARGLDKLYVLGTTYSSTFENYDCGSTFCPFVMSLSTTTGQTQWIRLIEKPTSGILTSIYFDHISISPQGRMFVCAHGRGDIEGHVFETTDSIIGELDTNNGNTLWITGYDSGLGNKADGGCVSASNNATLFIALNQGQYSDRHIRIVARDLPIISTSSLSPLSIGLICAGGFLLCVFVCWIVWYKHKQRENIHEKAANTQTVENPAEIDMKNVTAATTTKPDNVLGAIAVYENDEEGVQA